MEIKPIASGIAALGRGGDTMLVHMAPREVAGLQALAMKHGGSLTINPKTGLHEAGFLSSILPMAAGFALGPAGFALMSPMAAGLTVGGIAALTSGNLKKGLMAGLGAYGGAGLGNSFMGLSNAAADSAAGAAGQAAATQAGTQMAASLPSAAEMATNSAMMADAGMPFQGAISQAAAQTPEALAMANAQRQAAIGAAMDGTTGGLDTLNAQSAKGPLDKAVEGVRLAAKEPVKFAKENWKEIGAAAAPFLLSLADQQRAAAASGRGGAGSPTTFYNTSFNPGERNPAAGQPGQSYYLGRGFGPGEVTTSYPYAAGGPVPDVSSYPGENINPGAFAMPRQDPVPREVIGGYEPRVDPFTGEEKLAAGGGIAALHYAAGGKLLNGPGDGMSDDIPATIDGPQPQRAALADGEFVIPADVVSHLGNGSTKAGAKQLYTMMDRVRQARVGTKKQGKQINAERYMPA